MDTILWRSRQKSKNKGLHSQAVSLRGWKCFNFPGTFLDRIDTWEIFNLTKTLVNYLLILYNTINNKCIKLWLTNVMESIMI